MMFLESWNVPFYYALGTALMQVFIISLFLFDLMKGNSRQNYLNLPVAVETRIRMAQFLALPLCIMTHTDCTTAVYYLRAKYHPSILEKVPTATKRSWRFSLLFRFIVGSMLIFASFIQVMQSTTITDLFLNLESIVFVGEVDNFAFWLAEKGFLTKQLQTAAKLTKSVTMHAPRTYIPKRASTRRKILFGVYFVLMLGWLFIVLSAQFGRYVLGGSCRSFTVSFGDDELILDGSKINVRNSYRSYLLSDDELLYGSLNRTRTLLYSHFSGTYRMLENAFYPIPFNQRAIYYGMCVCVCLFVCVCFVLVISLIHCVVGCTLFFHGVLLFAGCICRFCSQTNFPCVILYFWVPISTLYSKKCILYIPFLQTRTHIHIINTRSLTQKILILRLTVFTMMIHHLENSCFVKAIRSIPVHGYLQ